MAALKMALRLKHCLRPVWLNALKWHLMINWISRNSTRLIVGRLFQSSGPPQQSRISMLSNKPNLTAFFSVLTALRLPFDHVTPASSGSQPKIIKSSHQGLSVFFSAKPRKPSYRNKKSVSLFRQPGHMDLLLGFIITLDITQKFSHGLFLLVTVWYPYCHFSSSIYSLI